MYNQLRVLYIGNLCKGSTTSHRLETFQEIAREVIPFDITPFLNKGNWLSNRIRFRFGIGPGVYALNNEVSKLAQSTKPDVVWVDKGLFLSPQTIRLFHNSCNSLVIHFNPDDPFGLYKTGWRVFLKALPDYDVHVVPRDVNIPEYYKAGARRVVRYNWAFEPSVHHPVLVTPEQKKQLGGSVGFIGDHEPDRANTIHYLASHGIPVRIWGPNWNRTKHKHPNMRIEGKSVWGPDYAKAICSFDIMLGFLKKGNRDLSTTRSIEIPACGTFFLGERTLEHLALFEEGKEAEFFQSNEELLQKVKYYLDNPDARDRIAVAGKNRCLSSGYSNVCRIRQVLDSAGDLLKAVIERNPQRQ